MEPEPDASFSSGYRQDIYLTALDLKIIGRFQNIKTFIAYTIILETSSGTSKKTIPSPTSCSMLPCWYHDDGVVFAPSNSSNFVNYVCLILMEPGKAVVFVHTSDPDPGR